VPGQVDPAPGQSGGPLVVLDPAATCPAKVGVVNLVVLGEQELDRGPVQVKADLDVTLDFRRAEVEDQDAVPDPDVELACAGLAPQALGDAVIGVQALDGPGFGGHRAVHVKVLRFRCTVPVSS
jgi:hypothetical protein